MQVLICDDNALIRAGIQQVLQNKFSKISFFECNSGDKAFSAVKDNSNKFDLVFLDVTTPGRDGIETLQLIKSIHPNLPVIMLCEYGEEAYAVRSFQLGAASFLKKKVQIETIIQAVEVALSGRRYVSPELADKISERLNDKFKPIGINCLSVKEHSIFVKVAYGKSLKEIASELGVSPKTITTYRSRILKKLKLNTNADITRLALQNGIIK